MTLNYRLMMAEVAARAQAGALAAGRTRFGNGSRHTDWLGTVSVLASPPWAPSAARAKQRRPPSRAGPTASYPLFVSGPFEEKARRQAGPSTFRKSRNSDPPRCRRSASCDAQDHMVPYRHQRSDVARRVASSLPASATQLRRPHARPGASLAAPEDVPTG